MRSKVVALTLVATILLFSSPGLAQQVLQTSDDWSAVESLSVGDKVSVEMKNGKRLQGGVAAISDTRLSLSRGNKVTDIERQNISRVYRVLSKSIAKSVGKSTLIGAAVGFGGGVGAGLALGANEDIATAEAVGIFVLLGAAIGAGVGAMAGLFTGAKKEKVLIYSAR